MFAAFFIKKKVKEKPLIFFHSEKDAPLQFHPYVCRRGKWIWFDIIGMCVPYTVKRKQAKPVDGLPVVR